MNRFLYIILLTLMVFVLIPSATYACGSKTKKVENTCNKPSDSKTEKNDCCALEKGTCCQHEGDCNGKCGNPSCHCPTHCTNFTAPFFIQLSHLKTIVRQPKFYYQKTNYSSAFLSIWLPPKIG